MSQAIETAKLWSMIDELRKEKADLQKQLAELTRRIEVPAGHIKLDDGRVVKVLGTLPMTADGCLAGDGAELIHKGFDGDTGPNGQQHQRLSRVQAWAWNTVRGTTWGCAVLDCYSTREAALAAQAKGVAE